MSFARKPFTSSGYTSSKIVPVGRPTPTRAPEQAVCGIAKTPADRHPTQGAPRAPVQPFIKSSLAPCRLAKNTACLREVAPTVIEQSKSKDVFMRLAGHHTAVSAQKAHKTHTEASSNAKVTRAAKVETKKLPDAKVVSGVSVAVKANSRKAQQKAIPAINHRPSVNKNGTEKTFWKPSESGKTDIKPENKYKGNVSALSETRKAKAVPIACHQAPESVGLPVKSTVSTATSTPYSSMRPSATFAPNLVSIKEKETAVVIIEKDVDSEKLSKSVAIAVSMGMGDQDLAEMQWFITRFRNSNRIQSSAADMLLRSLETMNDPFSVIAASAGHFEASGMPNPSNACFLNAAVQALMSCSSAVEALTSACIFAERSEEALLQRATLAVIASAISGAKVSADVFLGRFFPDMKNGKHCCANEFLSSLLMPASSAVAILQTSTAHRNGAVHLRDIWEPDFVIGNFESAGSLLVSVYPHYGNRFNWNSVSFDRIFTPTEGTTFTLKAAVFWEQLDGNATSVNVDKGHYWSIAQRGESWFLFDDMRVTQVDGPEQFCMGKRCVLVSLLYDRANLGRSGQTAVRV